MPSFTDIPLGADKFKITLAAPLGFFLTMIPLTLAPAGRSSSDTGPNAYPSTIHPAIASVTSGPASNALAALLLKVAALYTPLHPISAPLAKFPATLSTLSMFLVPSFLASVLKAAGLKSGDISSDRLLGKLVQNSGPGSSSYAVSLFIFGNLALNTFFSSSGISTVAAASSKHLLHLCHMPRVCWLLPVTK